ncbi:hypothetical protein RQP46_011081 [Phenoliferia psychrophenolica]
MASSGLHSTVTPELLVKVRGPIIAGDVTQAILYGVLLAQASSFVGETDWPRFSPMARGAVLFVLALASLATGCSIAGIIWQTLQAAIDIGISATFGSYEVISGEILPALRATCA